MSDERSATGCYVLIALLFLIAHSYSLVSVVFADVIYAKSGGTMKGLVVEEHRDRIVLSTESGEQSVSRSDIDEIFYDDPERNYLYLGDQAMGAGNFPMAKGFFRKALQINPQFGEAEDALHRLEDVERKRSENFPLTRPVDLMEKIWGMTLAVSDRPQVQKVAAGSPAQRAGVLPGDILVSLWGESLFYLPPGEVAKALVGPAGTLVKLTVERDLSLPPAAADRNWPGIALSMERLGLTVEKVLPKGIALQAGLLPKDRIVKMEGRSTRYDSIEKSRKILEEAKKKGIVLGIQRDLMATRS